MIISERNVEVWRMFVSLSRTTRTVKLFLLEFIMKRYNQSFGDPHSKLVIFGCFFVECGASKIAFLSRHELGSLRSFGTVVVTPESATWVHQKTRRLADESSIKWFKEPALGDFPAKIQKSAPRNHRFSQRTSLIRRIPSRNANQGKPTSHVNRR